MDAPGPGTPVEWRPFDADAFAAAREADRPILLSLTATWCRACHAMDRAVYAEPGIATRVNESFVPVRVDVDRRPRVRDRYEMGGLPTTAFLTPSGELLTGATGLNPEAFETVLDRVRELWDGNGADAGRLPRRVRTTPPAGAVTDAIERRLAEQLREEFDPDYGGWGTGAKFPRPRAIEFALGRDSELATRTLDPIRQHLLDTYDGGFFRYAANRDWSDPRREKLTGANAALLRAFADAYCHTGDETYRETAADVADFLTTTLWTGGAFAASQAPADPEYYRQGPGEREADDDPPVDDTLLAGRNALAAEALLVLHASTDDAAARRYAERALDAIDDRLVDDGVVRHYPAADAPRGLLADHARVARAFATAAQVLDPGYVDAAAAVADHALGALRADAGFVDGPLEGPGLLDRPLYDIEAAAAFANALVDLGALAGEDRYREAARDAVGSFAGASDRLGAAVGGYGTAAARVRQVPLRIEVAAPAGSDLHRAALRVADHGTVVRLDGASPPGTATPVVEGEPTDPASTPEALAARIEERAGRNKRSESL